jgi:hypothetical protein
MPPFHYLNPALPAGLARVTMPIVDASDSNLGGYGRLVEAPDSCGVEIVHWPAQGSRPVDAVHARVSIDYPREFGCLLEAALI